MIKLPQFGWKQENRSDTQGDLHESFCLDLDSNVGRVRTTRTKLITSGTGAVDNFGPVSAIVYYNTALHVFSGVVTGDNMYLGGNSPFDTLSLDTTSTNVAIDDGDAVVFNTEIYTTDGTAINSYNDTTETSISSGLTDNTPHLLCTFNPDSAERLYVTQGGDKVWSVSQGDALANSGSYTLDLGLEPDFTSTVLMAGTDRIWAGFSNAGNNSGKGRSIMVEWDGVTANTASRKYYIEASRIMAGVIKDDVPYVVDSLGRLMRWNGGTFEEVDRFPLNGGTFYFTSSNLHQNAIHPRGMAVDGDEILICVSNLAQGSTSTPTFNDFPAGVWAWSERTGLYHKYAPSFQAVADTGITNLTDFGQFRAAYGGPCIVQETINKTSSDGGRVMFGMSYFAAGDDDLSANESYGLWTDDTNDNTQKAGWAVSPRISASKFRDTWEKIYPMLTELETSGDLVEIKYRTKDETPTYMLGTWTGTDRFSTTTELTAYEQGDEITVVNGKGGGTVAHARSITSGAGSEVVFDRDITGITVGQTSRFRIEKWKKVGKIQDMAHEGFTIGVKDHWIQIKVYMQWTGKREWYGILLENTPTI